MRLSVELIRTGVATTGGELAGELAERSGLNRLRLVVLRQFEERSRVLKARSALAFLAEVLRTGGCTNSRTLQSAAEQLSASSHEFEEVRLLGALRSGGIELRPPERMVELDQLLGGSGHDPASRLGLDEGATSDEVRIAAMEALSRWHRLSEHPLTGRSGQVAARTATRTLEGIIALL